MYSYTFDKETGGLLLNSTPTNFSKEPRPVYAQEMDLLGFADYWRYEAQNETPYLWAESNTYWYRGEPIARIKGGDLYHAPVLTPVLDENGEVVFGKTSGEILRPIDIAEMQKRNEGLLTILENATVKLIVKEYEKYKKKLDIFHVAFSGGKDSAVLLDLVKKALPVGSFVVIFGDTGMEFPDTYEVVKRTQAICEKDGTPFYIARSHFKPEDSWKMFGPPARVLRWCCSVHKSAPQTLKMREITGKNNYVGMDFVGVRAHESVARSKYDYENFGKKQKGQYSFNPILEWTSAEVWLYILTNDIPVNGAYKKGNSRAGCLFCPMGGGRNDYIQYASYPREVSKYIDLVKSMNSRNAGDEAALCSYLSNGGWNARKNGRDLNICDERYTDEVRNGSLVITIKNPRTDWNEWIKTVGDLPFRYTVSAADDGYVITCSASVIKEFPKEVKQFKQVFKKAAYCYGCRVCETNCRNGCIAFDGGKPSITGCLHCGQCHEISDGCLAYHSLRSSKGEGSMKTGSINSFANHAPKSEWVQEFFDLGNAYWDDNNLGKNQVPMFKKFLRESGLIDAKNMTTRLYDILSKFGWRANTTWGLIIANLSYNTQCRWYIENMDVGVYYERYRISDLLMLDGVSKDDATSVINAFKRFSELPMGTETNWGYVEEKGRQIDTLCRTKCSIEDNRVILYAIYKFVEKCNLEPTFEFHLSYLFDDEVERDGISPVRMFGIYEEEEWKSILLGLSTRYPEFINATFTNDLKTISLKGKTSAEVLELFEEDL